MAGKTVSADGIRPVLSLVTTQRKGGIEYTVATDGRRLSVITQPTYKPDTDKETEEFYNAKGVQYKRGDQPYPNWRQVIPDTNKQNVSITIDLSHYSFLAKGSVKNFDRDPQSPSKKDKEKRIATPLFQDGQNIVFKVDGHRAHINPIFMRDLYKQMQELGKKLGFPPTLKAYYFDSKSPLLFTAEHNGITFQSIIMPLQDPVKDEKGYNQKDERGRWLYKTPALKPGDIILGEQPTIYGEQETPQNTGSFSLRVSRETIAKATSNKMKSKERIELCTLPRVLSALGENAPGIYTRAETMLKLAHKHHLSDQEIEDTIKALDDPLLVIKESSTSYIFYLPIKAKNKAGKLSPVMAALRMKRDDSSGHYLMSAYPLENTQKIEERIRRQDVVYSKYDKATLSNSNAPSPFKPDLVRLMVKHGFTDNVLTEYDLVNFIFSTQGISDSFPSQQETSVSSLSLRRRVDRNINSLLSERETTLARVSNYIKREADRTANIMGKDTELQRAGVALHRPTPSSTRWTPTSFPKNSSAKTPQNTAASATCATSSTNTSQSPAKANSPPHAKPPPTPHRTDEPPSPPTRSRGESTNMKRRIWQHC